MSGWKKSWVDNVKAEYKRKYKISIRIIEEGVLIDYDDVEFTYFRYNLKDLCRIFYGNDIIAVKVTYNQISDSIIIL